MKLLKRLTLTILIVSSLTPSTARSQTFLEKYNYHDTTFNVDTLAVEILRSGVMFPEIVLAQSLLETGWFTSKMFNKNNNLFGMKLAKYRQTTAVGERYGHAKYDSWIESVWDYQIWQESKVRWWKEDAPAHKYYSLLSRIYAKDKNYLKNLRRRVPDAREILDRVRRERAESVYPPEPAPDSTSLERSGPVLP